MFVKKNIGKLIKYIFLSGFFLLPLVFWPWAIIPYEIPKVQFFQRWMEILGSLGLVAFFMGGLKKKKFSRETNLSFFVFFFLLIAWLASLLGVDFKKSLWGNYYRADGLLTLLHLAVLFFFLNLFWRRSWRESLVKAIAAGCFLTSLWILFLGFRFHVLADLRVAPFGRAIGGPFGQPNFLAGYLLVCLPFIGYLYSLARKNFQKIFWCLVGLVQLMAMGLTFSRASALGALIFIFLWLIKVKGAKGKILVLLIFLIFLLPFLRQRDIGGYYISENRARIFMKGFLAFTQKPLFGWGWANFDYAFTAVDWPEKFLVDVYVDKAHSGLLEVLVTTGLLGFGFYLAIIIRTWQVLVRTMARDKKERFWLETIFLVFFLYFFHSQTNVISIAEEVIFWSILGIVNSRST